ncbi:conserved protein of unknown function [Methanocaldococcus lauensis]|uniref:Uncharacterized protein n=1 Tax=Methanocaldococcus lauensis TaxID=2546128 RepID=A0A8D6PVQ8_9EURY|nr:hypothetical protein [Methanocaldococcus lauensis]CAB3288854.1 conserved protein of unknown function [Methanocaldococcus lauensis]
MKNSYAEYNAVNITIKNVSSGEIIYQEIFPCTTNFYESKTVNGINITINYTNRYYVPYNNTLNDYVIIWYGDTIHGVEGLKIYLGKSFLTNSKFYNDTRGGYRLTICAINYNFNTPNTNNNTKAPIPLNVYLLIFAFLTYIVYRKSKNLT